jgi:glycosyltransferase involved in cell wall biosynthesis
MELEDPNKARQKVIVVMPAYNAAKTLRITYDAIPMENIDHVILVDDGA